MTEAQTIPGSISMGGVVDDSSSPEECNQNGNRALAEGDHTTAVQWYTAGLHRDAPIDLHHVLLSNRSSAYAHLCRSNITGTVLTSTGSCPGVDTGDWRRALNDAETCVQLQPHWPRGHACRGAALEGLGRQTEALEAFQEATRLDPSNMELSEIVSEIKQSLEKNPAPAPAPAMPLYGAPMQTVQATEIVAAPVPQPLSETRTMPLREVSPEANNVVPTLSLNTSKLSPSANTSQAGSRRPSDSTHRRAGVGMHIVLDDSHPGARGRVLLMQLAPWSPLQGQANIGDILTAIDGVRSETLSFEKISNLILGPVGSPITLSFLRPTAYPVQEWDVTVDRVFPSDQKVAVTPSPATRGVATPMQQPALRASAPVLHDASPPRELRSPQQQQYRSQMESVLSSIPVFMTLTLDEDYDKVTSSANTVQYFKNKLRIDLATALQVAPARFVVGGLAAGSVLAGLKILPSTSGGGGVPGVEPLTPAEIAADLKAQSVDLRSALRRAVPTLTHAAITESPLANGGTEAPATPGSLAGAEQSDMLRSFNEELQLLALFCKAPASEANLASFSKQGSKLKPKHVLRTYQAVHELKKDLAKNQEEAGRLHAELQSTTKGLVRDAELQKVNEEAERLQKGLEIRDRAITTYKDELASLKQQLSVMEKQKDSLDEKMKIQRELVVKQEDQIASLRKGVMPSEPSPQGDAAAAPMADGGRQPELEAALKQKDDQIASKNQEVDGLMREVNDLKKQLNQLNQARAKPSPSISLTNGNVYGKDELKQMVPNYEWDTFFSELLKIKPKAEATATSSPPPQQDSIPAVSPSQTGVPLDPDEPPLPSGWTKDIYEGKPLYVNHSTRSFSWIHPAKVAPQAGAAGASAGAASSGGGGSSARGGGDGVVPSSSLHS